MYSWFAIYIKRYLIPNNMYQQLAVRLLFSNDQLAGLDVSIPIALVINKVKLVVEASHYKRPGSLFVINA